MDDLVRTAKALATVLAHGQSYEDAAQQILSYDSVPYPVPYVFMSTTVVAFLRALAATEGAGTSPATSAYPLPSYGPDLRESSG